MEIRNHLDKRITDDNSLTFYSEEFEEFYHSKSGAIEESFLKFAVPSKIATVNKDEVTILDICFGLGYNSMAGIVEALKNPQINTINIVALELDPEIMSKSLKIDLGEHEKSFKLIKCAIASTLDNLDDNLIADNKTSFEVEDKKINIRIILNDARESIKMLKEENTTVDYIFHDPFSPKKCPILWTPEFFQAISYITVQGGILTTYSCARVVKDGLKEAGFERHDGPTVGRRSPSTIAYKL